MPASKKTAPTPRRTPRPAGGARPVEPPAPEPVVLDDGTQVAFSWTGWLADRGLLDSKPVEVGGRVFHFRAAGTAVENAQLLQHMTTGNYRAALLLLLADPEQIDDLMGRLVLPYSTDEERKLWGAFTRAVSGVTVGESQAS